MPQAFLVRLEGFVLLGLISDERFDLFGLEDGLG